MAGSLAVQQHDARGRGGRGGALGIRPGGGIRELVLERRERRRAIARALAERGHALVRVERERAVEQRGERLEVEAARAHERGAVAHGNAHRAAAQSLALELPAERALDVGGVHLHPAVGELRADRVAALAVDQGEHHAAAG